MSCDGGAATGKSTGARMVARRYNLKFLSSGLLYRYASFILLKKKPKNEITFLRKKFKNLNYNKLKNISLHSQKISEHSALIAKKNNVITKKELVSICKSISEVFTSFLKKLYK